MEIMSLNQLNNIPSYLSIFALISYILWGINISKEDFETGKIRNSKIILGLKIVSVIILLQLINTIAGYTGNSQIYIKINFYKDYIINLLFAFSFSIILWYGEIWPAGDAKFFILNLMFLPLIIYSLPDYPGYLWISTMINIFVIAGIISIYRYLKDNIVLLNSRNLDAFKEVKEFYINKIKKINLKSRETFIRAFGIFSIFVFKQTFYLILYNSIFNIFKRTDIFFFIMFFLWPKIRILLVSKIWNYIMFSLYSLIVVIILLSDNPLGLTKLILSRALKNTLTFGFIFAFGKIIFEQIIEKHNTFYASKNEIVPGMVLSSKELKIIKENPVFDGLFEDSFKDGLDQEQVEALKKWMENHPDKNVKLEFVKSKPFAYIIFIGCIIELILQKNIVKFIR